MRDVRYGRSRPNIMHKDSRQVEHARNPQNRNGEEAVDQGEIVGFPRDHQHPLQLRHAYIYNKYMRMHLAPLQVLFLGLSVDWAP